MNQYWTKSIILHVSVVVLLAISGLSFCQDKKEIEDTAITVDLMPIGSKTNIKPAPKQEKQEKPTPPKKEEKQEEPEPEKPKEKPKEEPKKEAPSPEPVKKTEPVKEPPKEEPKKESSELDSLLKTLEKTKPTPQTQSNQTENTDAKSQSTKDFDPNKPLTVSEHDFIISSIIKQIEPCWNIPAGAKDAQTLSVTARIYIDIDGTMSFKGIDNEDYYMSDPYRQVAADAVKRAVLDPRCNPLKEIPLPDRYQTWKKLKLEFDPSRMIR